MAKASLAGLWHIYEMSGWDADYFNMQEQAYLKLTANGSGEFLFGLVNGDIDLCKVNTDYTDLSFAWEGADEMDEASGRGEIRLVSENEVEGMIDFESGDESTFKAKRA